MNDYPSTEPELLEVPETAWPKVVGIISIVIAVCGLGCQVLGFGSIFLTEWGMAMGGMDVTMPTIVKITAGVSAVLMTCLGFLLLAGGIALVRRRRVGVSRLKTWAVLRILMIAVGVAILILTLPAQIDFQESIQEATNQMLRENGQAAAVTEFDENSAWNQIVITTGGFSALAAIFPLFIAFYLSRQKIKEEVETWE